MELITYTVISTTSALLTHELSKFKGIGPLRGSAIYSLLACGMLYLLNSYSPIIGMNHYEGLIFGGAFVGSVCEKKYSLKMIATGGLLLALIFYFIGPHTYGYGGAIGTSSFISCMSIYLLRKAVRKVQLRLISEN